jgi:hypothetical protein
LENECAGKTAAIVNDRSILSSEMTLHNDYDLKYLVEKGILIVSLKGLVAKTN